MIRDIAIQLLFEKHSDGRYFIKSVDVPGLHLAGMDFAALQADLEPVVKDLLFHNLGFAAESVTWVPSLEDAKKMLDKPPPKMAVRLCPRDYVETQIALQP